MVSGTVPGSALPGAGELLAPGSVVMMTTSGAGGRAAAR